ncbi:SMI1/KNR4 family protein [Embleya sp. NBC_00896]|uniref:SMI1/KNR4 family protein n=1 Tax=Embleya sp. NBC_00896 TaxID=2975961 RepID=UPI003870DB92|nr:SMI1/KNR4 family protein [Embleya sp. NBC_00896]
MSNKVDELESIIPALLPCRADLVASPDWPSIERDLGTALPHDYRCLADRYRSTLRLDNFIGIALPRAGKEDLFVHNVRDQLANLAMFAEDGDAGGYSAFPVPDGLLPWGESIEGDTFYWHTAGNPDEWSVVVNTSYDGWYPYPESAVGFLVRFFGRRAPVKGFPPNLPRNPVNVVAIP